MKFEQLIFNKNNRIYSSWLQNRILTKLILLICCCCCLTNGPFIPVIVSSTVSSLSLLLSAVCKLLYLLCLLHFVLHLKFHYIQIKVAFCFMVYVTLAWVAVCMCIVRGLGSGIIVLQMVSMVYSYCSMSVCEFLCVSP